MPIQAAREGVPTGVLGLPIRYLNTTSEVVHQQDVANTVKLLLGLITRIQ
jgi:putative aminopeptidase FrvX